MAAWDTNSALASLRSSLGDGVSDKFEYKTSVFPTPDSVTTQFFVGQTRVVPDTLRIFHQGVEVSPSGTPDYATGAFLYAPGSVAPSGEVEASFYYQWFSDAELTSFINDAASIFGFETLDDGALPVRLRGAILDFAAYTAYMRKAAEYAETVEASAQGYTFNRGKAGPNWKELAAASLKAAEDKVKLFVDNPAGNALPQLRFLAYRLRVYVPPS